MAKRVPLVEKMMHAAHYLAGENTYAEEAAVYGISVSGLKAWTKIYKSQNPHWREYAHESKCYGASDVPEGRVTVEAEEGLRKAMNERGVSMAERPHTEPASEPEPERVAVVEFSDAWKFMHCAGFLREAKHVDRYVEDNKLHLLGVSPSKLMEWVEQYKVRNPHWRVDAYGSEKQSFEEEIIDRFARDMKAKMLKKKAEGYKGWDDPKLIDKYELSEMLLKHVYKGDPVDVANFCMMLAYRGDRIDIPATEKPITHVTIDMLPLKVRSLPGMPAKFTHIPEVSITNFLIDLGASLEAQQNLWDNRAELDQMTLQQYAEDEITLLKKIDALKETLKIFVKELTDD